jgi:hypothetical protein
LDIWIMTSQPFLDTMVWSGNLHSLRSFYWSKHSPRSHIKWCLLPTRQHVCKAVPIPSTVRRISTSSTSALSIVNHDWSQSWTKESCGQRAKTFRSNSKKGKKEPKSHNSERKSEVLAHKLNFSDFCDTTRTINIIQPWHNKP